VKAFKAVKGFLRLVGALSVGMLVCVIRQCIRGGL